MSQLDHMKDPSQSETKRDEDRTEGQFESIEDVIHSVERLHHPRISLSE